MDANTATRACDHAWTDEWDEHEHQCVRPSSHDAACRCECDRTQDRSAL